MKLALGFRCFRAQRGERGEQRAEQPLEADRARGFFFACAAPSEVGELAFSLSEKIVHSSLRDDERQRQLVDDFIAGIGASVEAGAAT